MSSRPLKKIIISLAIGMSIYGYFVNNFDFSGSVQQQSQSVNRSLQDAYDNHRSDIQIKGSGVVIKRLPDDNDGSRHQKFLLKVATGQTLLVAHNIDLADKIISLKKGDTVDFNGEYEWNSKGGVLHWTHHDPRGRHVNGWLKHQGKIYQ
ncbi:MAG: DUF3465 domain-containing protein [Desulfuromusa sp.]|nr:DUF3465 domain-containing protein [Desulfuromusa sp.]